MLRAAFAAAALLRGGVEEPITRGQDDKQCFTWHLQWKRLSAAGLGLRSPANRGGGGHLVAAALLGLARTTSGSAAESRDASPKDVAGWCC